MPPSIESEDVQNNLTVVQNNTITIDCPAIGVPQPSIIWFKDEVIILIKYLVISISFNYFFKFADDVFLLKILSKYNFNIIHFTVF